MKASKESRVLLGLVLGSIVLFFVPFRWTTKLICGPLSLAAVFLASRQRSRLRPEASMDERDFLLVAQAFGLLTILGWALFLCYVWPMRPSTDTSLFPRSREALPHATAPMLLTISRKIGPPISRDRDYWFWIDQDNALVIKGRKPEPCTLLKHNLGSGREFRLDALSKVYSWGLHNHTTVSPDGKWLLWRNQTEDRDQFCVASLVPHGRQIILKWNDDADEHEDMQFLPDSRHWMLVDRRAHQIEMYDIERPESRRVLPVSSNFPDASSINAEGLIIDVDEMLPATFGRYRHDVDSLITDGATEATIISAKLLPQPRVDSTAYIDFPRGTRFDSYVITKTGDKIAWLCIRPGTTYDGDGQIASVWVTDGRGRNWGETGQFSTREKGDAFYVNGLHLAWTSDGKRLRFEWRGGIREVSVEPTTAAAPHISTGVPPLAQIAGVTVGESTFEEVERHLGKGFAYLGGHPLGSREWKIAGYDAYLDGDGMYNFSDGRGRVVESFSIRSDAENPKAGLPVAHLPTGVRYQDAVELGMPRDGCLNALSAKLGAPSNSGRDFLDWSAHGLAKINTIRDEDEQDWDVRLRFKNGRLIAIDVCAG